MIDNYLTTGLVAFIFIFLLWDTGKLRSIKQNNEYRNGFYFANATFSQSLFFKDAIEELVSFIEESCTKGDYNDFDKGIEQSIKQNIADQCEILNLDKGGDWYFCSESLIFKDFLTDREIIL